MVSGGVGDMKAGPALVNWPLIAQRERVSRWSHSRRDREVCHQCGDALDRVGWKCKRCCELKAIADKGRQRTGRKPRRRLLVESRVDLARVGGGRIGEHDAGAPMAVQNHANRVADSHAVRRVDQSEGADDLGFEGDEVAPAEHGLDSRSVVRS